MPSITAFNCFSTFLSITFNTDVNTTLLSPFAPSSYWSTSQPITLTLPASFAAVKTPFPEPPAATNNMSQPSLIRALPTTLPVASSANVPT